MFVAMFVVSLIVVIMFHEFGHYATAKLFGMKVEKFFLGFGPTLWSVRRGETEYGVKAIPAGGFVKILGMSQYEEVDPADAGRTFHEQAAWKRAIVLAAGSATHFLVAVVLLFCALAFVGLPSASNVVDFVTDDSPAQRAGLQQGDAIVAVDGVATSDFESVRELVTARGGATIPLVVDRDGSRTELSVRVAEETPDGERQGFLGVAPTAVNQRLPAGEALVGTVAGDFSVVELTRLTFRGLAEVFSPTGLSNWLGSIGDQGPRDASGPVSLVGIGQVVNAAGAAGDVFAVLGLLANLNIVLGILNILPLPPLDGGHLAVLGVEQSVNGVRRLRGKRPTWRLDPSVVTPVALAVILFFVVLSLTALYVDITKPASELIQ